jgi:two-component system response regulator PilR (NtrC family)
LFYRLNVIDIQIAPLRERREDLPALCATLLTRIAQETGGPTAQLSAASLAELTQLPLLGNVRELENLLHRAVALGEENTHLVLENTPAYAPHSVVHTAPQPAPTPASDAFSNAAHSYNVSNHPPTEAAPIPPRNAKTIDNPAPLGTADTAGPALAQTLAQTIPSDLQQHLDQQERAILVQALNETGFNRSSAAKLLGLTLRQIRYRIARLNIDTPNDSPQ